MVAALGQHLNNIVFALSVVAWPGACRVIRSAVLGQKTRGYVEASRAPRCGGVRIVLRRILPNVFGVYLVIATAPLGGAMLGEAALSFLGAGLPPPTPSWERCSTRAR